MTGFFERKEINSYKADIESSRNHLIASQISFANSLKNGLGTSIREELKNPPKPKRISGMRYRFKRFWNGLKDRIKLMFIYNDDGNYYSEE